MDRNTRFFLIAFLVLLCILLAGYLFTRIREFQELLFNINMEIRRTSGAKREHYIRERRRLWLSWIPFYGVYRYFFLRRKYRKAREKALEKQKSQTEDEMES